MSKKLPPIHPGEQLREEFMIPLGLSSNALARALNVTPARINEIVRERRGISADTALRLARFFNTTHQFWLRLFALAHLLARQVASKYAPLGAFCFYTHRGTRQYIRCL